MESQFAWTQALFACAALALITWGPTFFMFFRRRRLGTPLTRQRLIVILVLEIAAVVALAAAVNAMGFQNAANYVLAIALLIGAAGGQITATTR